MSGKGSTGSDSAGAGNQIVVGVLVAVIVFLITLLFVKKPQQPETREAAPKKAQREAPPKKAKKEKKTVQTPAAKDDSDVEEEPQSEQATKKASRNSRKKRAKARASSEQEAEATPAQATAAAAAAVVDENLSAAAKRRARKKKAAQAQTSPTPEPKKQGVSVSAAAVTTAPSPAVADEPEDEEDDDWEKVQAPKGRTSKKKRDGQVESKQPEVVVKEEKHQFKMTVPNGKISEIIGEKGASIRAIRDSTGCEVELPKKNADKSQFDRYKEVQITLTGSKKGITEAKKIIDAIVGEREMEDKVKIPVRKIGKLIGPGGANTKQIREKTGCFLDIPKENPDGAKFAEIAIRGPASAVANAKGMILDFVGPNEKEVSLSIPVEKVGAIVGPAGKNINKIREATGVEIQLPDKTTLGNSKVANLTLFAPPGPGLEQATRTINSLVARGWSRLTDPEMAAKYNDDDLARLEIKVPESKVGIIMGPKGARVIKIKEETGTQIEFPSKVDDQKSKNSTMLVPCIITGGSKGVQRAKEAVEMLVQRGFSKITDPGVSTVQFDIKDWEVSLLIGPAGKTINTFREKYGVMSINTPNKGDERSRTVIVGKTENAKRCKEAIKYYLQKGYHPIINGNDFGEKEVSFPWEKIRFLVGPKGSYIKHIKGSTKCDVKFPNQRIPEDSPVWGGRTDVVKIVGPKANHEAAHALIQKVLERPEPQARRRYEDEPEEKEAEFDDDNYDEDGYDGSEYIYKRNYDDDGDLYENEDLYDGEEETSAPVVASKPAAAAAPVAATTTTAKATASVAAAPVKKGWNTIPKAAAAPVQIDEAAEPQKSPPKSPEKTPELEDDEEGDEEEDEESSNDEESDEDSDEDSDESDENEDF